MEESQKKQKFAKILRMNAYASGDFIGGGIGMVISTYYLVFLTSVMGLSPLLAGLVTGIGKVWDGVTDPVMGVVVDRTRTKFGSCRPWFLIAAPFLFLSYFMLWYCFGIEGEIGRFFYYVFAYMFYSTAFTIAMVPYEALLPRMVGGYQERTNYSSLRMIYSGVACVASTYIYEWLVPVTDASPLSPLFTENFMYVGLVFGAMFVIPLFTTFFGTKEPVRTDNAEPLTLKKIFAEYKEMLSCKLYRKYYTLNLLGAFMANSISASTVYFIYLTYGNSKIEFIIPMTLVFLIINVKGAFEIAFFVPNVIFMKKKNKHFPYLVDLPLLTAGCALLFFVNSATPMWVFLIAYAMLGAGVSCLGFVPSTLLPDLSDVDELIGGRRREGVSAGLVTLGKKIVSGLSLTLFGVILSAFGLSDTTNISPALATTNTMIAIKTTLCAIPVLCCIFMIFVSRTYNLDAKKHDRLKSLIAEKREFGFVNASSEDVALCESLTGKPYSELWISQTDEISENDETESADSEKDAEDNFAPQEKEVQAEATQAAEDEVCAEKCAPGEDDA